MSSSTRSEVDVTARLIAFIRERFLSGDPNGELDEETPLLEYGVLDSLKVAILLNFIREELAADIPLAKISGGNFKNVRSISALVCSTSPL